MQKTSPASATRAGDGHVSGLTPSTRSMRAASHNKGGEINKTPNRSPTKKAAIVVAKGWVDRFGVMLGLSHSQNPATKAAAVGASTLARPKGMGATDRSDFPCFCIHWTRLIVAP